MRTIIARSDQRLDLEFLDRLLDCGVHLIGFGAPGSLSSQQSTSPPAEDRS